MCMKNCERLVQSQKGATTLQKAGKKQGPELSPCSTLLLAQGLTQAFSDCQQQFSEPISPFFTTFYRQCILHTDQLFVYSTILPFKPEMALTYFAFLVPNKICGFDSERS